MGFLSKIGDVVGDLFGGVFGGGGQQIPESLEQMAIQQWDLYKQHFLPYEIETMTAKSEILPEFVSQTTGGIDVSRRMDEAGAEVAHQFKIGEGIRRREISRYGIDPGSSTFGNTANMAAIERAKGIAGARTSARSQAESEKYARLGAVLDKSVPDPYSRATATYSGAANTYESLANRLAGSPTSGLIGAGLGAILGGTGGAALGYGIGGQYGHR